jgi:REP element-mobilizing transposase RayT
MARYDYARPGAYFVTVCTHERFCWFGEVVDGRVSLSAEGHVIETVLLSLPQRFAGTKLDRFVIMPNHIHAILRISGSNFAGPKLGEVVRTFKAASTTLIRQSGETGFAWQRNYHDHVIRDQAELERIRAYIVANPRNWHGDPENPSNAAASDPSAMRKRSDVP